MISGVIYTVDLVIATANQRFAMALLVNRITKEAIGYREALNNIPTRRYWT